MLGGEKRKMKIKTGEKYINLHTGELAEVVWKEFFNVGYKDIVSGFEGYVHYKTFQKHWRET